MLTDSRYQYGSYTRRHFAGDILYGVVSFADLDALISPQFALVKDRWAERSKARLDPDLLREYTRQLTDAVRAAAVDDAFFEQITGVLPRLRRQVFGSEVDRVFVADARQGGDLPVQTDLDQSARLDDMLSGRTGAVLCLQDPRFFPLMQQDLSRVHSLGMQAYAVVSSTDSGIFPSPDTLRLLLSEDEVRLLYCEGPLDQIQGDCPEAEKTCILYYGERGLTDCRNLSVPAFVRCAPESLCGRALTGLLIQSGCCDLYIPPHFDILPMVPICRRTLASFRQYAGLSRRFGDACYRMSPEELYSAFPETFFSVYDEDGSRFPLGTVWPKTESRGSWSADYFSKRDQLLGSVLDDIPGIRRLGGWFRADSYEPGPVPWDARGAAEGILVHGALIEKHVDAQVIISDAQPVSPRLYVREHAQTGTHLVLNYLFFLTSRLASLYNQLRESRPMEQTKIQGGHLDYLLCRDGQQRTETFPLYRKACMALMDDGSFSFFHFRLGGGSCTVSGHTLRWEAEDVDPALPRDTAVFTPYASCPDAGQSKFTYTLPVGAGRINLVLLQGSLVCARDGDVLLPCFGVVLSLSRETGLPFLERCGFRPASDGYYVFADAPSVSVCLDPPEGFSQSQWDRVRWAYGGGLTLIHEGICCFSDEDTASSHLAQEGWLSPLSAQTQESDIASMVRHPRTAIGLNSKGQLFALVFSGRSSVSLGADYREMCALARRIVPDVTELMNVDGGGSSLLAIASQGHLYEYSWPSTSPASLSGMARPVNSLFVIHLSSDP